MLRNWEHKTSLIKEQAIWLWCTRVRS